MPEDRRTRSPRQAFPGSCARRPPRARARYHRTRSTRRPCRFRSVRNPPSGSIPPFAGLAIFPRAAAEHDHAIALRDEMINLVFHHLPVLREPGEIALEVVASLVSSEIGGAGRAVGERAKCDLLGADFQPMVGAAAERLAPLAIGLRSNSTLRASSDMRPFPNRCLVAGYQNPRLRWLQSVGRPRNARPRPPSKDALRRALEPLQRLDDLAAAGIRLIAFLALALDQLFRGTR
jgi:hypothetical protein